MKRITKYPWKCSICGAIYESLDKLPVISNHDGYGNYYNVCIRCDKYTESEDWEGSLV